MAFLTDRTLATGVTPNDLIHIVITGDTSQNPAGSSYKATMSQVLDLINPTTLTGGTYNPATGAITFYDDNGGSFTVTGLLTGYTDTSVTAFTYNNANTFTILESDSTTHTATIDIVTGLTVNGSLSATTYLGLPSFSGGSGNCITDFYVTNVYGCSPITLKSESQFDGNTATGILSFAHGLLTTSSGDYSHSEGLLTVSSGNYSHSEGRSSSATTLYSHSEGTATIASGGGSHAEGNRTQSIGDNSHSEGSGTTSNGNFSHSEGYSTISNGIASHSEGSGTTASGDYSHSEGISNQSIGIGSHVEGLSNIAVGNYQHVQGQYNLTASTVSAFIIGNGKSNIDRSNLVLADVNLFNIYGNLNVTGTTSAGTISATTYLNLPTDVRVTGATYSNNTFTYTNNTGGTFNVLFNSVTGLTVNGNLNVTGNTTLSATTASTLNISSTPLVDSGITTYYLTRDSSNGDVKTKIIPGATVYGLFAQTGNSVAVSATTVESTIIDGGIGTLSVPANGFSVGDSFRADFGGLLSAKNNDTIRIKVKTGSVILADSGTQTMTTAVNDVFQFSINFTIRKIGAAGVAEIVALGVFHTTKQSNGSQTGFAFNTVNSTTFDTTISNTLDVTVQWSSNSALNSIYSDIFILNKIF